MTAPAGDTATRARRWTLVSACAASATLLLNVTSVTVASPSIDRAFGGDLGALQWILDAYPLSLAAFLLTAGSLADRVGLRRVFCWGAACFGAAAAAAAVAPSGIVLAFARGVQGVGAAALFATSLALIASAYPPGAARSRAYGIWGTCVGVGVAAGPLVGGGLAGGLGWRAVFIVNVPISAVLLAIGRLRLPESQLEDAPPPDWGGSVLVCAALALLAGAVIHGGEAGWSSAPIVAALAAGAALLVAFARLQRRREAPMLPPRLFRSPVFVGAAATAFVISLAVPAMLPFITIYFQTALHHTPLEAGLLVLPLTGSTLLASPLSGRASARMPSGLVMAAGLVFACAGALLMGTPSDHAIEPRFVAGLVLAGAGLGTVVPPLAELAVSVTGARDSGTAAGANMSFRQLGVAAGVAAFGAVFQAAARHSLALVPGVAPGQAARAALHVASGAGAGAGDGLPPGVLAHAACSAFGSVSTAAAVCAAAGVVAAVLLLRPRASAPAPRGAIVDAPPSPGGNNVL